MVYRVIGVMSGSSLDGLDIAFAEIEENGGNWTFEIIAANCFNYNEEWLTKLQQAKNLNGYQYQLLHGDYGTYIGQQINHFIEKHNLHYKVQLISSHGHTVFHSPENKMTAQLGSGAHIAAATGINTVSDLRNLDVAFGGQGAPIVPMGESLFWKEIQLFLNLGGIANLSINKENEFIAFDVCPANRVLNLLAATQGKEYDEDGNMAASGNVNESLLAALNAMDYYKKPHPKSLANEFGTDVIFPLVQSYNADVFDALRTYTEHIAFQIATAIRELQSNKVRDEKKVMITGGGAFNTFLIERIKNHISSSNVEVFIPEKNIIEFKEALIMALLGILRWREENTVLHTVTGATRSSIGGAVWIGQEA